MNYSTRTAPLPPRAAPATAPTGPATTAPVAAPVVARVAVFGPQAASMSEPADRITIERVFIADPPVLKADAYQLPTQLKCSAILRAYRGMQG